MVYIYNGLLLNHKKEWNNAICSNMDGTQDYHTKLVKERQISYAITHMRNLVLKGYKWTYLQAETDLQILKINLRGAAKGEMWRGGINQEFGINMPTLQYIR